MCGLLVVLLIEGTILLHSICLNSHRIYGIALMIVAYRQRAQNVAKLVKLEYQENRQAVYVDDLARVGAFTICALVSFS